MKKNIFIIVLIFLLLIISCKTTTTASQNTEHDLEQIELILIDLSDFYPEN